MNGETINKRTDKIYRILEGSAEREKGAAGGEGAVGLSADSLSWNWNLKSILPSNVVWAGQ